MPNYAYLKDDLCCPMCGAVVSDVVGFQWGYCPARAMIERYVYHTGDAIQWRACSDQSIRSWTYFQNGAFQGEGNIGDPKFTDVITRDVLQFYWDSDIPKRRCPRCHTEIDGAIVEIRDGRIVRARLYLSDEEYSDYSVIGKDEAIRPLPDWDDHPMVIIDDC